MNSIFTEILDEHKKIGPSEYIAKIFTVILMNYLQMMMTTDRQEISRDWSARGFSCDLWVDPPGQRWEGYVHRTDELVMVIEGEVEFEEDEEDEEEVAEEEDGDEEEATEPEEAPAATKEEGGEVEDAAAEPVLAAGEEV